MDRYFKDFDQKFKRRVSIITVMFALVWSTMALFVVGTFGFVAYNYFFGIRAGTLVSKDYYPGHTELVYEHDSLLDTDVAREVWVSDRWTFTIEAKGEDNRLRRNTLGVDYSTYQAHNLGDWVNLE